MTDVGSRSSIVMAHDQDRKIYENVSPLVIGNQYMRNNPTQPNYEQTYIRESSLIPKHHLGHRRTSKKDEDEEQ